MPDDDAYIDTSALAAIGFNEFAGQGMGNCRARRVRDTIKGR